LYDIYIKSAEVIMLTVEKYDPEKQYLKPAGGIYTAEEVLKQFPATEFMVYAAVLQGRDLVEFRPLSSMVAQYEIDPNITEEEQLQILEDIRNNPPVPEEVITSEERTAIALESLSILMQGE
jgi:hypothetical protein